MTDEITGSEGFGAKAPPRLWQALISLCQSSRLSWVGRLLAPFARKVVLSQPAALPVDLELKDFRLRCQFTDNYSEKKFVFTPWRYDAHERRMLAECLAQGGDFLDIGANIGLYTLTAAVALGNKGGRIVAFEPNPVTLQRLKTNIAANRKLFGEAVTLEILPIGIADQATEFTLHVDSTNLGECSIVDGGRYSGKKEVSTGVTVQCRPLLNVLEDLQMDRITVLKIDIEGAEDLALAPYLESAPDSLLAKHIFIENSQHIWSIDLFERLERRGYRRIFASRLNSIFALES
ncbi:FkbM family methyltransferase [Marinimicrobium sp. LS-A18]|uniref:FkbM family methyltransferase n=1 Tax=Marinimicrobium sp. LS-A18 TaxID=1381596 RepID=UPI000465CF8C|nr:FkbM family methyltransferase [Marinimicrobium sp. LS-A18]